MSGYDTHIWLLSCLYMIGNVTYGSSSGIDSTSNTNFVIGLFIVVFVRPTKTSTLLTLLSFPAYVFDNFTQWLVVSNVIRIVLDYHNIVHLKVSFLNLPFASLLQVVEIFLLPSRLEFIAYMLHSSPSFTNV